MKSLSFCNHCYSCILRHFDAAAIHSSAAALLLLLLSAGVVFLAWAAPAVGAAGPFVPPATPTVAPVISGVYPNDLDGNRIDDDLDELDLPEAASGLFEAGRSLSPPPETAPMSRSNSCVRWPIRLGRPWPSL
ncbi:MAG: hypothetical protein QM570_13445 [Planctomycetota bacterium]|jgi:hypothetical protein|nr:hypothetical protein [Planctomycetota bacterium]